MDRRRECLIEQGDAIRHADGRIFYRRNLLATLEQRDVVSTGAALAASRSLPFWATGDGETVQGVLRSPIIPCTIFERPPAAGGAATTQPIVTRNARGVQGAKMRTKVITANGRKR